MSDVLKLEGVTKTYNAGLPNEVSVLRGCDLTLSEGEVVALVAPSGSGKSTLLHIAGLLDTPDAGTVEIAGNAMTGKSDRRRTITRRQDVGFVYQFHHLLPEFTANQVASGLALTLFGLGLSALMGQSYVGIKPPAMGTLDIPVLSGLPFVGPILFGHDVVLYIGLGLTAAVWATLKYTRVGLILRAVGENHEAAHALGYHVVRVRILAILFGGACAGLGGAYISLIRVPQWTEGMTAGIGWIALALVVFASWKPWRVLLGAYLFGGINVLQLNLQAAGIAIPVEYLAMSPYLITILVLVILSADKSAAPASLARPFHASH